MKILVTCLTLFIAMPVMLFEASATNGAQAVATCKKTKGCAVAHNADGSNIDIIAPGDIYIRCEDMKSECTVQHRKAGGVKKPRAETQKLKTAK